MSRLQNSSVDDKAKEEWRKIDFIHLRQQQFSGLDQALQSIDQSQIDRKAHLDEELEQVEYLETENLSIQKELVKVLDGKRTVLGDIEKENLDFIHKFQAKANEKDSLRKQIFEIEHLIRLLKSEIDNTSVDNKRITLIVEKEDELINKKANEEKRVVKLVGDDIKDQLRQTEEAYQLAQTTQTKQEAIEKYLKQQYEKAQRDLERLLQEQTQKREIMLRDVEKIRQEVLQKRSENETIKGKNRELENELERLENYANQLKSNIQDMMQDYRTQFEQLTQTIDQNTQELDSLRKELSDAQKNYFSLRTHNEILEEQVDSLKAHRDLDLGLNEERRLNQLKINIEDASLKTQYMESEVDHILERWHGKIAVVKKAIEEDQIRNQSKVLGELVDKYIQQIFERNRKLVEVIRIKEDIEAKIQSSVNEEEIRQMQDELQSLIKQYEKLVGDKIHLFNDMIGNLKEISKNNDNIVKNEENIARLKNNVEIVQRDINQKKRMLLDQRAQLEDLKAQIREVDSELQEKEVKIQELDDVSKGKDLEITDLNDMIQQKDQLIRQLQDELMDIEEKKRREEEERRRRELEAAMNKPEPRKWYIPVKGDPIDEMMAKYLNDCPYYVPVKRLGDGQYMYGSKKIFAKIMNGKLIIRVGGGYMLIDEFLKNYAETEKEKAYIANGGEDEEGGVNASPAKRGHGSPNRASKSPAGRK
eukprot:403333951